MKEAFREKAVAINEISNRRFTVQDLYPAFKEGFEKGLSITTEPYTLTSDDEARLEELKKKYASDEWNYKR
jgi:lipoate-protein ligase A